MTGVDEHRMPLLDHLRELRTRMIRAIVATVLAIVIALFFSNELLAFLTAPVEAALGEAQVEGGLAIVNSPFEGIYTWLRVGFLGGLALASPVLAFEAWGFIGPGLYKTEKKVVIPLAVSSTLLFFAGAAFAYYAIFPFAFPFFFTVIDANISLSVQGYLSAIIKMLVAFGMSFQLPVATYFLARVGLIDHHDMIRGFRFAVVGIFVVAALITPPDILTQSLLAAPLCLLYGVGIVVARIFSTKVTIR